MRYFCYYKKMCLLKFRNAIIVFMIGAMAAVPSCKQKQTAASKKRPNIIALTVDTLRADHIGLYGYHRDTMPAIGEFAKTAVVFDNAVVSRGNTRASYASMLTGLYPFHHGIYNNGPTLHKNFITLPEILKKNGYHTAAFMSNFVMLGEMSGCNQGFDIYDDYVEQQEATRPNYERTATETVKAIISWLESDPPQPFFLFTNFIDPHGPYHPPKQFRDMYKSSDKRILDYKQIPPYQILEGSLNYFDYVDWYDGEIRYLDEAMGVLIEELKRKGLWENSLIIFTSDHGESLGEHDIYFEHQHHIWEETAWVPLVIRLPEWRESQNTSHHQRVKNACSPMDLMPSILDYLRIGFNKPIDGKSLMPLLTGKQDDERAILLEFPNHAIPGSTYPDVYGVRTASHKLIRTLHKNTDKVIDQKIFDIETDPMEQKSISYQDQIEIHRKLTAELDSMLGEVKTYEFPFILTSYEMPLPERKDFVENRSKDSKRIVKLLTEDQIKRLRSLGYVE